MYKLNINYVKQNTKTIKHWKYEFYTDKKTSTTQVHRFALHHILKNAGINFYVFDTTIKT